MGTVAERSVKRFLATLVSTKLQGTASRFDDYVCGRRPWMALAEYTTHWLFEAALLNLRGSSDKLVDDYGFWYHLRPDGKPRTLHEEVEVRSGLFEQARQFACLLMELWKLWAKSAPEHRTFPLPKEVVTAFHRVFGVWPKPSSAWAKPRGVRPLTVIGKRADVEQGALSERIALHHKVIAAQGPNANVRVDYESLTRHCGRKLHSLLRDLLEIAAIVYVSDIHLPRNDLFARDLTYLIPVRHPEVWKGQADALARIVSFLSYNAARFEFVQGEGRRSPKKDFSPKEDERCVALFSGGLDSYVGALDLLERQKRKPILVSHYSSPMLARAQKDLVKSIGKKHRRLRHAQVQVCAEGRKLAKLYRLGRPPRQVLYQYARSFLFLTLASCVALENGIAEIYIHENGPAALNPALSEARFSTRTTHPTFVRHFSALIKDTFGVDLRFVRPYALKTKGEVVQLLEKELDEEWQEEIKYTNSCWAASRVTLWAKEHEVAEYSGHHCGRCLPCIWRRSALESAGLGEKDDSYLLDEMVKQKKGNWLNRARYTVLMDQLRFCENALARPPAALLDLCPDFCDGEGNTRGKMEMYGRFSRDIVDWFGENREMIVYSPSK